MRARVAGGAARAGRPTLLDEAPANLQAARLQPFIRDFDNPFGAERAPHVQSITVTGPFNATGAGQPGEPPPVRLPARPRAARRGSRACAASPRRSARRAFRRPLTAAETAALLDAYRRERASGTFDTGVEAVLRRILASPSFVFRPEAEPAGAPPGPRMR